MQKSTKDLTDEKKKTINKSTAKIGSKTAKKESVSENSLKTSKDLSKKKTTTKKKSNKTVPKSATSKKNSSKDSRKQSSKTPKVTTAKSSSKSTKLSSTSKKKNASKSSKKLDKTKKVEVLEYYDLPYRYNQTVVKILAQTPNTLFVYWDISDVDRKRYVDEFGDTFFDDTFPVLIVHNKTMNYSFEIEVNDFANSWYFEVNDAKCIYEIELGRRVKYNNNNNTIVLPNNYMYVTSSNIIEAPNNHILFEKNQKVLFFRNVKNDTTFSKDVSQFEFMKYVGRIYNIYDVYKKMYKNEELQDLENNPTSGKK